jgi:hemoglobin
MTSRRERVRFAPSRDEGRGLMTQPRQPDQTSDMIARTEPSLYRRMGGYDLIAAAIDGMLMRMRGDPQFARFSMGRSEDSLRRARQFLVDQLCALAGGPCLYTGRDMKTSHKGLGITESDWQTTVKYMRDSMTELNIPQREQDEVITLWTGYKDEIVE